MERVAESWYKAQEHEKRRERGSLSGRCSKTLRGSSSSRNRWEVARPHRGYEDPDIGTELSKLQRAGARRFLGRRSKCCST
jgi:hypothetical protein